MPTTFTTKSQNSTIVVRVSADHYQGAPQFQLMVDGKPVGAVQTVTAVQSKDQWQDFTFKGDFGADGVNNVEVVYLNDVFNGAGKDRNLYVDKITVDGKVYQSETHADYELSKGGSFAGREKLSQAGRLVFDLDGSDPVQAGSSPPAQSKPATGGSTSTTTGPDAIVVRVSGDHYEGAPQFQLMVDGKAVGAIQTVTAVHGKDQWQDITFKGDFDTAKKVEMVHLNDKFGGAGKDRNLYVDKITVDGKVYEAETSSLGREKMSQNGAMAFTLGNGSTAPTVPSTPAHQGDDTIVVRVSGDHYEGAPQFQLLVDGKAVGDVHTVKAVHGSDQWQNVTFKGDFDDADKIEVVYLKDKFGGAGKDRNLYLDEITVNGTVYEAETKGVYDRVSGSDVTGIEKMNVAGKMVFDIGHSDPTPAPAPKPVPSPGSGSNGPGATGQFTVGDDGKIYDPQGREFEVHGANLFPGQHNKSFIEAIGSDGWDFNALRINWLPGKYTYEQLDQTIETFTSMDIVTIVDWHVVGGYGDSPAERKAILDHFEYLAETYKDNPYVWYGGYNEPGGAGDVVQINGQWQWDANDVNRWVDLSRDIIDTVRDAGAKAPVFVPSMAIAQDVLMTSNWNREVGFSTSVEDRSAILKHGDRVLDGFDNVAFDVHLYGNYNTADRLKHLDLFLDAAEDRGIAIVFGEYGSGVYNKNEPTSTTQSAKNMATLRDEHSFGDMVWHASSLDPNDLTKAGNGGVLYTNSFTNPTNLTEIGQIAWEGTH